MSGRSILIGLTAVALMAACASAPRNSLELDQARSAVERLSNDPIASQSATRELQMARAALERAEQAWQAKEPEQNVDHLAYLAERQAEIGTVRLAEVRAREAIARGEAGRNAVLLAAREREAQLATSRADANAQDADSARHALEESQRQFAELQAKRTARGMVLTLGDVLFDTARADLRPGAASTLDRLARFLQDNTETRILIEGYTDSRGTDEYNEALSRRRSTAVAEALESRGTASNRISVAARGEALPVASNETPAGRQLNRRVEIVFSDMAGNFSDELVSR